MPRVFTPGGFDPTEGASSGVDEAMAAYRQGVEADALITQIQAGKQKLKRDIEVAEQQDQDRIHYLTKRRPLEDRAMEAATKANEFKAEKAPEEWKLEKEGKELRNKLTQQAIDAGQREVDDRNESEKLFDQMMFANSGGAQAVQLGAEIAARVFGIPVKHSGVMSARSRRAINEATILRMPDKNVRERALLALQLSQHREDVQASGAAALKMLDSAKTNVVHMPTGQEPVFDDAEIEQVKSLVDQWIKSDGTEGMKPTDAQAFLQKKRAIARSSAAIANDVAVRRTKMEILYQQALEQGGIFDRRVIDISDALYEISNTNPTFFVDPDTGAIDVKAYNSYTQNIEKLSRGEKIDVKDMTAAYRAAREEARSDRVMHEDEFKTKQEADKYEDAMVQFHLSRMTGSSGATGIRPYGPAQDAGVAGAGSGGGTPPPDNLQKISRIGDIDDDSKKNQVHLVAKQLASGEISDDQAEAVLANLGYEVDTEFWSSLGDEARIRSMSDEELSKGSVILDPEVRARAGLEPIVSPAEKPRKRPILIGGTAEEERRFQEGYDFAEELRQKRKAEEAKKESDRKAKDAAEELNRKILAAEDRVEQIKRQISGLHPKSGPRIRSELDLKLRAAEAEVKLLRGGG